MKKEKDKNKIKLNSEKINKREKKIKVLKMGLLMSALFLIIIYFILSVVYSQGAFTISLGQDFAKQSGIVIYEDPVKRESKRILEATKLDFIDNISINWLPQNINNEANGSHNGDNYIAYTFYVENQGSETVNYWYTILVDDVIKNIDKAIRVMVYRNDEKVVYAKAASNGETEKGTEKFFSDDCIVLKERQAFKDGEVDKFTIVIFIEGDDPDCIDSLIGGEMKMHLEIDEEHILQKEAY